MQNRFSQFRRVVLWSTIALVCECCATEAASPKFGPREMARALIKIANVPYEDDLDMDRMNQLSKTVSEVTRELYPSKSNEPTPMDKFARLLEAFTSTKKTPGETWEIVQFADSSDYALCRLRDNVGIPPPKGGAILRIYSRRSAIPEVIQDVLPEGRDGAAVFCRYVVVCAEGKSQIELRETVSRCLASAYINSYGGYESFHLPEWFSNGVTVHLVDPIANDPWSRFYYDIQNWRLSSEDREHRAVFRYLNNQLGWYGLGAFIRQTVESGSTDEPLRRAFGDYSYDDLRRDALRWRAGEIFCEVFCVLLGLAAPSLALWGWKLYKRTRANSEQYDAEDEVSQKADEVMEELKRFDDDVGTPEEQRGDHDLLVEGKLEELALSLVHQGRALENLGKHLEAKRKLNAASHLVPWSSMVKSAIEAERGSEDGTDGTEVDG